MSFFPEEPIDSPVGYFAARLNQTLNNGRWTLIRKLGWGSRSSCWLATDSQNTDIMGAIKIYTVSASKEPSSANERDVLQKMRDSRIIWRVPVQRDSFYEEGEKGEHLCLVLHALGPSIVSLLDDSEESGKYLPLHAVKKVVGDVAEALCSLHENNIIHGAVTPDNVLLPSYQRGPEIRDFLSKNPSNSVEEVTDNHGKVYHAVKSQPLNTFELKRESTAMDFARFDLHLSNYSYARIVSENVALDTRSDFLPPEASINGSSVDTKADIWMLGCTIYTLLTGRTLFENAPGTLSPEKLKEVISRIKPDISATNAMSGKEAKATASIIKACLKLNPADRPTASSLLRYHWVDSGMMCSCGWCPSNA